MLSNSHNRHESMVMDMDMDMDTLDESAPVSRVPSPPPPPALEKVEKVDEVPIKSEEVVEEKPKKMGNLMKELKQDVTQGAMEFNMDSFF
jgi:hypothetical protein